MRLKMSCGLSREAFRGNNMKCCFFLFVFFWVGWGEIRHCVFILHIKGIIQKGSDDERRLMSFPGHDWARRIEWRPKGFVWRDIYWMLWRGNLLKFHSVLATKSTKCPFMYRHLCVQMKRPWVKLWVNWNEVIIFRIQAFWASRKIVLFCFFHVKCACGLNQS